MNEDLIANGIQSGQLTAETAKLEKQQQGIHRAKTLECVKQMAAS